MVTTASSEVAASQLRPSRLLKSTAVIGIVLASVVVLVALWLTRSDTQTTALSSIVVLPLENLESDPDYSDFADGITEDIITDLSRVSSLLVFASNTTFKYRNRQVTPQELREELNVDYVLKGSMRRQGGAIRVNMQLIDAKTGFNTWAQRYDRNADEVFAVQDEVTNKLIEVLSIKLSPQEKQRLTSRATSNLLAYEHFLQGQGISKELTRQANARAREAYHRAIKIDPMYGRVYGALAFTLAVDFRRGWTDNPIETLDRALALAEQAVNLDDTIPHTHWVLGYVYLMRKEHEKAMEVVREAIRIAPNYADGYGLLALIMNNLGHPMEALEYADKGMRLNPYYTWDYLYNIGRARYTLGHFEQAIAMLEKAESRNENAIPVKLFLAASYIKAGRSDDAEWVVEQLQLLNESTTISHTTKAIPMANPELKNILLDDLRKAGLPE
jgi:adenylate cyclase